MKAMKASDSIRLHILTFDSPSRFSFNRDTKLAGVQAPQIRWGRVSGLTPLHNSAVNETNQTKEESKKWPESALVDIRKKLDSATAVFGSVFGEESEGVVFQDLVFRNDNGEMQSLKEILSTNDNVRVSEGDPSPKQVRERRPAAVKKKKKSAGSPPSPPQAKSEKISADPVEMEKSVEKSLSFRELLKKKPDVEATMPNGVINGGDPLVASTNGGGAVEKPPPKKSTSKKNAKKKQQHWIDESESRVADYSLESIESVQKCLKSLKKSKKKNAEGDKSDSSMSQSKEKKPNSKFDVIKARLWAQVTEPIQSQNLDLNIVCCYLNQDASSPTSTQLFNRPTELAHSSKKENSIGAAAICNVEEEQSAILVWSQNERFVNISVETFGENRYYLRVERGRLVLRFCAFPDSLISAPLASSVVPKYTRHEIVGSSLEIRLTKAIPGEIWSQVFDAKENKDLIRYEGERDEGYFGVS